MGQEVNCWLCSSFAASSLKAIVRHIGAVHARDSNFYVQCGIQGCVRTYRKFYSFKKHVYRHHKVQLNSSIPQQNTETSGNSATSRSTLIAFPDDEDELDFLNTCSLGIPSLITYDYTEQAALFVLKAKHIHKISQSSMDDLLADISSMIADRVHYIQNKVQQTASISSSALEAFKHQAVLNPFRGLTTRYLQLKYYREHFGLLVSELRLLHV